MAETSSPYTHEFYQDTASEQSAQHVLACLPNNLIPTSVADFGCGEGFWLTKAKELGADEVFGFDGNWVDKNLLHSKSINFQSADFSIEMPTLERRFDLAISVEVAEHLPAGKAQDFVELLCNASDMVLFSAAIKHQGGNSHVNEQWQAYWIEQFKQYEYECFDLFRPQVWNNENVLWWYRQNIFLFVNNKNKTIDRSALSEIPSYPPNLVHPKNYDLKIDFYENRIREYDELLTNPSFDFCVNNVSTYLKRLVTRKNKKAVKS